MNNNNIYSVLLLIGSICFALLVAEALSRSFYEPTSSLNLDAIADKMEAYVYYPPANKQGFREEELNSEVLQNSYRRIIFLGDSFTFGHGVVNGGDLFSNIIEERLNKIPLNTKEKYHIYNAGIPGTEPKDWFQHLEELLPTYKPHTVFAIFFLRDGTTLCTSITCHKDLIRNIKAKYENTFWYKYSYIGKFIGNKLVEKKFAKNYLKKMINSYLGSEEEKKTWIEQQGYLLKISELCKRRGIDFHLVIFPMLIALESGYQFHDVENEIIGFANKNSIPVFSLINGFIGQISESLWVSPSDQHPNEKGHLIAADTLYPYVRGVLHKD